LFCQGQGQYHSLLLRKFIIKLEKQKQNGEFHSR